MRNKVEMTELPKKVKVPKDRTEPAKATTILPIDPEDGEDDQISLKSYTRGKASHRTPDDGSKHTNQPIEMIDEPKPKSSAPRRSGRARMPIEFYQPGLDYVNYTSAGESSSCEEPLAASDAETWLHAMRSEMDSIHQNRTWELVALPMGRKVLPCKWVFQYKYVSDSEKPKYKARPIAKGFKNMESTMTRYSPQ